MMKQSTITTILLGSVILAPLPVLAQSAASPRWETRTADNGVRPLVGTETFRLGKESAPGTRPDGLYLAIRITRTNETIVCDKLPYTFRWDTTRAPDGWHWLEIVLIDTNGGTPDKVIDSLKVYVRNDSSTPLPDVSPMPTAGGTPPIATRSQPTRSIAPGLSSRRRGRASLTPRLLSLPDTVSTESIPATVGVSDMPLSVPRVTALFKSNDSLYLGLPDGGIAIWDESTKKGSVARVPGISGSVRALAAGSGVVYWTAGNSDKVYVLHTKDKSVTAFDARERVEGTTGDTGAETPTTTSTASDTAPWIERLAVLGKKVVLMGTAATRIWDGDSGLKPIADMLPSAVAQDYSDALVRCYVGANASTKEALLVFATPDSNGAGGSLHLWSGNVQNLRGEWKDRGILSTRTDFFGTGKPELSLTPFGMLVPEKVEGFGNIRGVQFASWSDADSPVAPQTLPLGVTGDYNANAPQSAERVSVGGSGIWWTQSGVLFHADPFNSKRECFMPWNGAGNTVTALLADKEGAYVATDKGVRRVILGQPNDTDGYGGYIRVPLGEELAVPQTDQEQKLLSGIEDWQGVPYKWGGQTKQGTDCSGFVGAMHQSLGVSIPRTSEEMGQTRQGKRVLSELHYGDTLVYPGHVALYIGNGRTAETVGGSSTSSNGSVSKATIWRRRNVIVKRFLP